IVARAPNAIRLRARRVDENKIASRTLARAIESDYPAISADHGGSVANAYRYPAETETLVTVAFPDGRVVQWHSRASANKVTYAWAGALFDRRVKTGAPAEYACIGAWLGRAYATLCENAAVRSETLADAYARRSVERDRKEFTTPAKLGA